MTTIVVPGHWLQGTDIDVNAWLASKGATVVRRERNKIRWKITIEETLTDTQKTTLKNFLEVKFNAVAYE